MLCSNSSLTLLSCPSVISIIFRASSISVCRSSFSRSISCTLSSLKKMPFFSRAASRSALRRSISAM